MGTPLCGTVCPLALGKEVILNLMVWDHFKKRISQCLPGFVCLFLLPDLFAKVVCHIYPALFSSNPLKQSNDLELENSLCNRGYY